MNTKKCDTTGNYTPLPYINKEERYSIVQGLLPLVNVPILGALGGHYYLAVLDRNKNLVTELHGLATTRGGEVIPIGTIGDKLKYYNTADFNFNNAGNNETLPINSLFNDTHSKTVLFEGNGREVEAYIRRANMAGSLINDKDIDYAWFGVSGKEVENSNAVNNTLIQAMGLKNPYTEDPNDRMWTPGDTLLLLPPEDIAAITDMVQPVADGLFQCWHLPFPAMRLDPLALDLDADGTVATLPLSKGVHFDLDNSGFAEKTAWVGKEDGLLVFDRNGNGRIDNGGELFGNETRLQDGSIAEHGFAALADLDDNHDGRVDALDSAFANLLVWQDKNSDGISQTEELINLAELDIAALYTDYESKTLLDANGVDHREHGQYTLADGTQRVMHTLWFESDKVRSVAVEIQHGSSEPLPDDIAALPTAMGMGNVHALHDAMRTDKNLQALTQSFVHETNPEVRKSLSEQILQRWAKADMADGKVGDMEARHLAVLEAFWGQKALQETPVGDYARRIEQVYQDLHGYVHGQLSLQTHHAGAYRQIGYTQKNHVWSADYSVIAPQIVRDYADGKLDEATLADLLDSLRGIAPDMPHLAHELHSAVDMQSDALSAGQRETLQTILYRGNDNIAMYATQSALNAGAGDDNVQGNALDNMIKGGDGNDVLHGGTGHDRLEGGAGNDRLYGGTGENVYVFSGAFGHDVIVADGRDRLYLEDLGLFDVTFSRTHNDLVLKHGENSITVRDHFADGNHGVEGIIFADGSRLDKAGITASVRIEDTVQQLAPHSSATENSRLNPDDFGKLLDTFGTFAPGGYDLDTLLERMENGTADIHLPGQAAGLFDIGKLFGNLFSGLTDDSTSIDRIIDGMERGSVVSMGAYTPLHDRINDLTNIF
ncbi:MAG: calcium-binding protein [Cardiobacteriaceae bacterium]|nr:calcium-binding protein [Cardiobacteriaceae bacterium]